MKNILLFTLTILMVKSINAQVVSDSIHMNPGYTHQVFYQLSSQTKTHAPFNGAGGWDLGFEVTLMNAAVISNPNSIVVYKVPNGDSAKYASLSYAGYDSWEVLYNTDTSWEKGAFNIQANSSNPFDFGWGTYDFTTHAVFGDSIYLIDKGGVLYKFWIRKKTATGDYIIRYADLTNGGSDVDVTIPAATYGTKNFVYFNIDNQSILDIEPATSDWDVVFNHYITQIPYLGAYPVTGVQSNFGVAVAKAYPVDVTTVSYLDYSSSLSKQLSVIGYDWKTYDFSINQYVLEDSLIYFVKSKNNAVNSLRF
ncbi:MAG: hypothetical protein LH473_07620, partial [Chitinophagales bacterium]|nr:hypothetical protein [Chitinophagales bacterium]